MGPSTPFTRGVTLTTAQRSLGEFYFDVMENIKMPEAFDDFVKYDSKLIHIVFIKTIVVSCSSVFCVLLNSMLLLFLMTNKTFRNLKFFPLMLQAMVDISGPGVANVIHEMVLYPKFKEYVQARLDSEDDRSFSSHISYYHFISLNRLAGVGGCFATYFRRE